MRRLAWVAVALAILAAARWLILRALPWDPVWLNDDEDDDLPFEQDPYLSDLLGGLSRG